MLSELLHHFYADVRQHKLLAEIFDPIIENWPEHLEKIADFWSTMTGGPAAYSGTMPMKHIPLGLREEHFQAWLGLWEHHCRARLTPECAQELVALAHQIGNRLRRICGLKTPVGAGDLELPAAITFRPPVSRSATSS